MKRINTRRIKAKYPYSVQQLAEVLKVHSNTIHEWIREGMPRIQGVYPYLLKGQEVIEYLNGRTAKRKCFLALHEFHCCKCHAPRTAWEKQADLKITTAKIGMLKAICPVCGGKMNKLIALRKLSECHAVLEIRTLQDSALIESISSNANHETSEV